MEKKIIAVALVLVLMVTVFVGCSKKYDKVEIDGKEYYVITNDNGEPIKNDDGIMVAVTDENNEVITNADGEPQTRYYIQKNDIKAGDKVLGDNYDLRVPDGWTGDSGAVYKNGTDNNCYIKFSFVKEFGKEETIETYLEANDEVNETLVAAFSNDDQMDEIIKTSPDFETYRGARYTIDKSTVSVGTYTFNIRIHKIVDADGKVIHYAENYYLVSDGELYKLDYVCTNGVGYDESFDFRNYIAKNFKFYPKEK